ncbi:glycoside hydrolase [Morchella snyderi]|nr:glycoside hydrolase [Morchella snyderi]
MMRIRGPTSYKARIIALVSIAIVYVLYVTFPGLGSTSFDGTPSGQNGFSWFGSGKPKWPRNTVQYSFKENGIVAEDKEKAEKVRRAMQRTFWKYKVGAWGRDEIKPVSGSGRTTRNGWAATIVDTLTTAALMGLEEEFKLELNFTIKGINFNDALGLVDPFETTIRYLGALVSTVDLIDAGVLSKGLVSQYDRHDVLSQAVSLATKLAPGFDSPTGMIWPRINFTTNQGCREHLDQRPIPGFAHATIGPARAGSNWLENKVLSKLTGKVGYELNATRAWKPLVWNRYIEEWPGLIDSPIDIVTGAPVDRHRSWGAGHDSYYEYLIKAHILAPHDPNTSKYRDRWIQAVESTMKNLASWSAPAEGKKSKLFLSQWKNGWFLNEMGHLACFAGGNFLLGGKYLGRDDIVQFGLDVIDACHEIYVGSTTRIGPEYFSWIPADTAPNATYEPQHETQYKQLKSLGYWVTDAKWVLRPETVESYFYAYRITGNKMYQEWAWDAFNAFTEAAEVEFGYAEVKDVTKPAGPDNIIDKAESFWGAETLKYYPSLFSAPAYFSRRKRLTLVMAY